MKKGGISFLGALGLVFITLKLCDVIDWSWWLVLLPIYGPVTLALVIFITLAAFFVLAAVMAGVIEAMDDNKKAKRICR